MEWLSENWIFLIVVVGMVAMHLFGHGGHGHQPRDRHPRNGHRH